MSVFSVDLHVHTDASLDGRSSLQALTAAAKAANLDALAITDHNLCTPVPEFMNGVLLIPGCEISTQIGHITGLFLNHPLPDLPPLPAPEDAVAAIHASGGLAVLAHPYQNPNAAPDRFTFPLDGIEAANARANFKVPDANNRAAALAYSRNLPYVGGSDAHDAAEIGNAYTALTAESLTRSALRQALADGKSAAVLRKNTPIFARASHNGQKPAEPVAYPRAAAYMLYCFLLDILRR